MCLSSSSTCFYVMTIRGGGKPPFRASFLARAAEADNALATDRIKLSYSTLWPNLAGVVVNKPPLDLNDYNKIHRKKRPRKRCLRMCAVMFSTWGRQPCPRAARQNVRCPPYFQGFMRPFHISHPYDAFPRTLNSSVIERS